jgi:cytochrome c peroxidase
MNKPSMNKLGIIIYLTVLLVAAVTYCWPVGGPAQAKTRIAGTGLPMNVASGEPISPVPESIGLDPRKVALGRSLFIDVRLSNDDTISCASCHALTVRAGGADPDHVALSDGIGHALGTVNAPTVLNSSLNFKQFWDGRADTLEDQIEGPIHNPKEMGTTWEEVVGKLLTDDQYPAQFQAIYGNGIRSENVRDAITSFEKSLLTPDAPFDRYLRGDKSALTPQQRLGYGLFKQDGCIACHQGVNIGGNLFERFGVQSAYFQHRGHITAADFGRFAQTGRESDKYVFRVPSLRNVALTAPYFHDGMAKTLASAVETMAKYQLGHSLSTQDRNAIVDFLRTLTGRQDSLTGRQSRVKP